jgi:hypothetical protein
MSHLNFRKSLLTLAPVLLLYACGKPSADTAQGAAVVQDGNAPAQVAAPAPAASPQTAPTGASGLREFRDPVTGQTREPTAAELKALAASQNASKAGNGARPKEKEVVFPNGTVAVEETILSEMKGCIQKDGRTTVDHECKSSAPATVTKP